MSLSLTLSNALSGLNINQRALQVTSSNIANVNTDGYARKSAETRARVLDGVGAGVEISAITRAVDEYLQRDLRTEGGILGERSVRNEFYARMQELFGAPGDDGAIGARVTDLASAMEEVAANPENPATRIGLVNEAQNVTRNLNEMARQVQTMRAQADREIGGAVADLNQQLETIADLNLRISTTRSRGLPTADLEDQRAAAIDTVAGYMSIQYFEKANGQITVLTRDGQTLVDSTAAKIGYSGEAEMTAERTYVKPGSPNYPGTIGGIILNPSTPPDPVADGARDLTASVGTGRLSALIEVRDQVMPDFGAQMDTMAAELRDQVNALHNLGHPYPGRTEIAGTTTVRTDGSTQINGSGTVTVGVFDSGGVYSSTTIALGSPTTVASIVTAINGAGIGVTASVANGRLELAAAAGSTVIVDDYDETTGTPTNQIEIGGGSRSFSHFFGLNDFFTGGANYGSYASGVLPANTRVAGAGTLTIETAAGQFTAAYSSGQTLSQVAQTLTNQLAGTGFRAEIRQETGGARLMIKGPGDSDALITDSGSLLRDLDLRPSLVNAAAEIGVRPDIAQQPDLVSRGTVRNDGTGFYLSPGDDEIVRKMAGVFTQNLNFGNVGGLPTTNTTLAGYGNVILSYNASQANTAQNDFTYQESLYTNLNDKALSVSGVNMDEELANMTMFQNAYQASARVVQTTSDMYDILLNLT
ncbi:MAG: flagellar hook-associated protein FlgK [Inquilinaceae bacterium]